MTANGSVGLKSYFDLKTMKLWAGCQWGWVLSWPWNFASDRCHGYRHAWDSNWCNFGRPQRMAWSGNSSVASYLDNENYAGLECGCQRLYAPLLVQTNCHAVRMVAMLASCPLNKHMELREIVCAWTRCAQLIAKGCENQQLQMNSLSLLRRSRPMCPITSNWGQQCPGGGLPLPAPLGRAGRF